jgi:acetyl esterase/lipase
MESGELGYSDAQRMALLAAARRSMSGGTAEAAAEAQRAAAMGGSAGGAFQNQLALQANQSNALAQHAGVIEDASARQAALQRQEIRRRIDEAADRGRGFWSNMTKRQSSSSSSPPLDYTALESAFK